MRSLTNKSERLCVHNYLMTKAGLDKPKDLNPSTPNQEVNRYATVDDVIKNVKAHFPTASFDQSTFLQKNKQFVSELDKVKNLATELSKYLVEKCPNCDKQLVKWAHKTKESYLLTLCEIKKVKLEARFCPSCKLLVYYNLYEVGFVPVNNKVI